jgi:hypothetical protein
LISREKPDLPQRIWQLAIIMLGKRVKNLAYMASIQLDVLLDGTLWTSPWAKVSGPN